MKLLVLLPIAGVAARAHPLLPRQGSAVPLATAPNATNFTSIEVIDHYAISATTCDRGTYAFFLAILSELVVHDMTVRFLFGQPRYGPEGAVLDSERTFIDRTYSLQDLRDDSHFGSRTTNDFLFYPFFTGSESDINKQLRHEPWKLSPSSDAPPGFVLPQQYAAAAFVYAPAFLPNGSSPGTLPPAVISNFTVANGRNCTKAFLGESDGVARGPPAAMALLLALVLCAAAALLV
ncbi:hypothetical protein FA10DRAFT_303039 [Acaromyces ingoldii]|uniref:Heme haloperoxidase family profile domain-containing protein n=1 Tax=Acaromyces ingoldii TaxID=215250 RepID=A0A316YJM1_9BASI|nr:hypothetical protein FA10DRAFT_303039 [Acaromyces ingoldii]PWN89740.1 hypothetical protein FA10DRAFT_303039 [Acaromyces ingoldii]